MFTASIYLFFRCDSRTSSIWITCCYRLAPRVACRAEIHSGSCHIGLLLYIYFFYHTALQQQQKILHKCPIWSADIFIELTMLKRLALHSHNRYLSNLWNPLYRGYTQVGDYMPQWFICRCIARSPPPPTSMNFCRILNNQKVQDGGCTLGEVTQLAVLWLAKHLLPRLKLLTSFAEKYSLCWQQCYIICLLNS